VQIGPFSVERELGRGGMGAVYLGRKGPGAPPVAVKVIHADLALDPELAARFEREGAALERLDHPNVVSLVERGSQRGGLWLAMEFVPGVSLAERLKTGGPWPSHAARELLLSLCEGIAHSHQAGVLHRDLKPANVILREADGLPLVADFGLALPLDVSQHLTQTGEVLGSPGYLAPEQCGLGGPASPATDVYGLGALLYCVLTGEPPLRGASLLATLDQVLNATPRPPSELVPDIDPSLERVCLRCLAKDPAERYRDARELQQALTEEPAKTGRRGPLLAFAFAAAALLPLGFAAFGPTDSPANPNLEPQVRSPRTPPPTSLTPSPGAAFEVALADEDWSQARALVQSIPLAERTWQRYRLLVAELDATGETGPAWRTTQRQGVEEARALVSSGEASDRAWSLALEPLLLALRDPYLGLHEPKAARAWVERLQVALDGSQDSPARTRALVRALAVLKVSLFRPGPGSKEALAAARIALASWAQLEASPWRPALWRARLAMLVEDRQALFQALSDGELEAQRSGHPWALSTFYDVRVHAPKPGLRILRSAALLSRAVLRGHGPRSLKLRAALRAAQFELQRGAPEQACALLSEHPLPEGTPRLLLKARARVLAAGYVDQGAPTRALEVLEELRRTTPAREPTFLFLQAAALAQAGRADPALLDSAQFSPGPGLADIATILVYLNAAALTGSAPHFQRALGLVRAAEEPVFTYLAWEVLERALALEQAGQKPLLPGEGPARASSRQLALEVRPQAESIAEAFVKGGEWETAIRVLVRLRAPTGPRDALPFVRAAYQALRRGLEEEAPRSQAWGSAYQDCRARAEGAGATPLALALLESLCDVSQKRRQALLTILETGRSQQPSWEELAESRVRLLKESLEDSWPERLLLRALLRGATRSWAESFPESSEAQVAFEVQRREPGWRERVDALAEGRAYTDALARASIAQTRELEWLSGEAKQELRRQVALAELLSRTRRDLLLAIAEVEARDPARAVEALALLALCEAWTGGLGSSKGDRDAASRARLLVLVALSEARLGNKARAAKAADEARPLLEQLQPPERGLALARLARVECLAQPDLAAEEVLARFREALQTAPSSEAFCLLARSSGGGARSSAYVAALSYDMASASAERLLREVKAGGLDPVKVVRGALPLIEARNFAGAPALGLARALFLGDETSRDRATLLWEALRSDARSSIPRTRALLNQNRELLQKALDHVGPEATAILHSSDQVLAAIAATFGSDRPSADLARDLEAALAAKELVRSSDLSDRLGVLRIKGVALTRIAALRPGLRNQERIKTLFQEWAARPYTNPRVWLWIAELHRSAGDFKGAVSLLDPTWNRVPLALPEVRNSLALLLAESEAALGNERRALRLLEIAAAGTEDTRELIEAQVLRTALLSRAQEHGQALSAARVALGVCPRGPAEQELWQRVQVGTGRALALAGQTEAARNRLDAIERPGPESSALQSSEFLNFEALVLEGEELWSQALGAAQAALALRPEDGEGHLRRGAALVGLGRKAEAVQLIEVELARKRLTRGDRLRLQAWLAEQGP